jgi:hypothetical protein
MNLTYYIYEGWLIASSATETMEMAASSGGRGGSTLGTKVETPEANNPYVVEKKWLKQNGRTIQHGGPLPPGVYKVHPPIDSQKLGRCALLEPQFPTRRTGLYLHGPGQQGSQGCLVPHEKTGFSRLIDALDNDGGGRLLVFEGIGGDRFA